jgi:parvulin-like peptidyl-prolyl isomerase
MKQAACYRRAIRSLAVAALLSPAVPSEIIDRVAAVVGRGVVTQSEVEREARLEIFFGAAAPDPAQVLERLIRQRLIFQEMEQTAAPEVTPSEIQEWITETRPAGADPVRHGLSSRDLEGYARRQIQVEKFLNLRFRSGLTASDQEVEAYYQQQLLPELKKRGVDPLPPLDSVRDRVARAVQEERVSRLVEEWMTELRQRTRVRKPELEAP